MQIITCSDSSNLGDALFGARSDGLLSSLREGMSSGSSAMLSDLGRRYAEDYQKNFEAVSGWAVVNASRRALAGVQSLDNHGVITPLFTDIGITSATPFMQRMIMADDVIRGMWQKKRIDGFSDTYSDKERHLSGADLYDHRLSMSGVVTTDVNEEGNKTYQVTEYFHELRHGDAELSASNRLDIRRTNMFARTRLKRGLLDLTSSYEDEVV